MFCIIANPFSLPYNKDQKVLVRAGNEPDITDMRHLAEITTPSWLLLVCLVPSIPMCSYDVIIRTRNTTHSNRHDLVVQLAEHWTIQFIIFLTNS